MKTSQPSSNGGATLPTFEPLSSKPVALPAGMKRPTSLQEDIQRIVRSSLSNRAAEAGAETFEESLDFGEGDEVDGTPWEYQADARSARLDIIEEQAFNDQLALQRGKARAKAAAAAPKKPAAREGKGSGEQGQEPRPRRQPRPPQEEIDEE